MEDLKENGLISNADAKLAWAKGEDIEYISHADWCNVTPGHSLSIFDRIDVRFRIKPKTIKLELELPKPFEPKEGERYFYVNSHADAGYGENTTTKWSKYLQFGAYRTEAEVKQVVEQLRKIKGAV